MSRKSGEEREASWGWLEFQLAGPLPALELFAEFMQEQGARGAVFSEDPEGGESMVTSFLPLSGNAESVSRNAEARVELLKREFPGRWRPLKVTRVHDHDWAEEWKKSLKPLRLEPGIWVVPSFLEAPAEVGSEPVLRIDPGMAFGTGEHPSTRACVELVATLVKNGARSVLDLGTGTGIIAMAAAKFGAERVMAAEIDPIALQTAKENLAQNGLSDKVRLVQGFSDPEARVHEEPFEVIAANLFAEALKEMMPFIARHLAESGHAVLSGILPERAEMVMSALEKEGLSLARRMDSEGWVSLLARKSAR